MSSISVTVKNESDLLDAIAAVRSDSNPANWVVAGHAGKPDQIELVGSGTGDLDELKAALQDDNVCYALFRFGEKVDVSSTVKFLFVHWEGPDMSFVKKGRYGIVRGDITDRFFSPAHVDVIGLTDKNELTSACLQTKGNIDRVLENVADKQERSFSSIVLPNMTPTAVDNRERTFQVKNTATANNDIQFSDDLKAAVADIRNDESSTQWVIAAYADNDARKPRVTLFAKGSDGVTEMASKLDSSMVMYAFCRVQDVYEGIKTVKFVYVQWIGSDVNPMMKARTSVHKGAVHSVFEPFHVSFQGVGEVSDISEGIVAEKIGKASGSMNFVKSSAGSS
eukprot:CFRG1696T1